MPRPSQQDTRDGYQLAALVALALDPIATAERLHLEGQAGVTDRIAECVEAWLTAALDEHGSTAAYWDAVAKVSSGVPCYDLADRIAEHLDPSPAAAALLVSSSTTDQLDWTL